MYSDVCRGGTFFLCGVYLEVKLSYKLLFLKCIMIFTVQLTPRSNFERMREFVEMAGKNSKTKVCSIRKRLNVQGTEFRRFFLVLRSSYSGFTLLSFWSTSLFCYFQCIFSRTRRSSTIVRSTVLDYNNVNT